jgi:hypothetical protein
MKAGFLNDRRKKKKKEKKMRRSGRSLHVRRSGWSLDVSEANQRKGKIEN